MSKDTDHLPRQTGEAEMGALLRLVGGLGLSTCLGIGLFFFIGLHCDRRFGLNGLGILGGIGLGVSLSLYYSYRRIMAHMHRFAPEKHADDSHR